MSFNTKLLNLLKTDTRFIDDEGEIILAAVQDRVWKIDHNLVRLLLSDFEIKTKFFDEIEGHWVFNINTFLEYISQKEFLDNSYTRFRNRIGLTIGGKFLRERGEVALVWPYKDGVLEGGQTKEEEKRKEIFFNEVLAQDEINRLLDPKVLTHFVRYTPAGAEPVTTFQRDENGFLRENLILKGNNLLALHTLKSQFRGKIKLIYIDPPYNTGNDSFKYNDKFNHSAWLTFMKNRLEIAKDLLRQDGSIWINVDINEAHYLKVLCDEIFGRENFVTEIVWHKTYTVSSDAKGIPNSHDQILVFQKSLAFKRNLLPRSDKQDSLYKYDDGDGKGLYRTDNLSVKTYSADYDYPIINPLTQQSYNPPQGRCWVTNQETIQEWIKEGRVFFGKNGNGAPQLKRYLNEVQEGVVPTSWWDYDEFGHNDQSRKEIKLLFGSSDGKQNELFTTPKPEKLIQKIIQISTFSHDIVLDFFAGSATTGAVALKTDRQFILCEQMSYTNTIPVQRLQKVLQGDDTGVSKEVNWQGGGSFIYCELMKYNEAFIERIQVAQNTSELLEIWQDMAENSFLNWYVKPQTPEEAITTFDALGQEENGLEKQKHLLVELLDKNQLYVNLSEIEDTQFRVSEEDKALNLAFYGEIYG